MSDQLELKHLAPYLPYGLCVWDGTGELVLDGMTSGHVSLIRDVFDTEIKWSNFRNWHKPILRPLSDLNKEIEHNGERFVPIKTLRSKYGLCILDSENMGTTVDGLYKLVPNQYSNLIIDCQDWLEILNLLHEWHFDTNGLIDKGLAVDINILDQ